VDIGLILQHIQHPYHVGVIQALEQGDLILEQLGISRMSIDVNRFHGQFGSRLTVDA
jgi:hypothetical protein